VGTVNIFTMGCCLSEARVAPEPQAQQQTHPRIETDAVLLCIEDFKTRLGDQLQSLANAKDYHARACSILATIPKHEQENMIPFEDTVAGILDDVEILLDKQIDALIDRKDGDGGHAVALTSFSQRIDHLTDRIEIDINQLTRMQEMIQTAATIEVPSGDRMEQEFNRDMMSKLDKLETAIDNLDGKVTKV